MNIFEINKTATHDKGAIALPTILILASMLLAIGLAINLSSNNKIETIKNNENALEAFYVAESGIKDATEKIARNKNFSANYILAMGAGAAEITVANALPVIIIESKGTYDGNVKTIKVTINVDNNGKILPDSLWQEL